MGALKGFVDYILPLRGLKDGDHQFDYSIDGSFFNAFEQDEILDGKAKVDISMRKRTNTFELAFKIAGDLKVNCDRCLDEVGISISTNVRLVLKGGDRHEEISEEIITITEDEMEFDLAPYIFDYIRVALPIKKVHEDGMCNEDMLDRLDDYTPKDEETTDPRWDELKNLLDKN